MTIQAEVVKNGASEHRVQFYDCDADLVESAGSFLEEGVRAGELAVVIATEVHRREFGRYLAAAGIDVTAATAGGSLLLLDAATTLSGFVSDGQVAPDRFRSVISPVLRHAAGRRVRAYGEMVALLWDAGHVPAAIDLEGLWNGILREIPVSLLCAYRSESVSGPDDADALRDVCGLHSTVVSCTGDPHATGCSAHHEVVRGFAAELDAPYAARRFVVEELEARGCDERLVYEAALVVTELASNAVLHAGSPCLITLLMGLGVLRLSVHDGSTVPPTPRRKELMGLSGRGLRLVDVLADRWGVEVAAGGKVVWVELADGAGPSEPQP